MKFMLDTNICIYVIKQRPETVLKRFTGYPVGDLGLSIVSLAELEYGIARSSQTGKNRSALAEFLSPLEVAAFDREAASAYGNIRAAVERKGNPIGSLDLLIAAHAVSLDVPLVTNNVKEFRRIPDLRVENWV
ncbi:MAG TPA: type II toxin-antitoxin system VapC family toxin [Verrucomicrobiae bacterium]|jgi:tRNA(fMet)-specific endonuclease VapC|nr:type II toxin-antitoxin system VapC family toxin [Verrucomicrobiae bacterium]